MGRGQVQSSQARISRTWGHVYAVVPEVEYSDQPDMQGTFYPCICFLMHPVYQCILCDRFGLGG